MNTQTQGEIRQTITLNLNHRIAVNTTNHDDFLMSAWIMTDRALAVVHLLSLHIKCTDGVAQGAIDSVKNELLDVQQYIQAFTKSLEKQNTRA